MSRWTTGCTLLFCLLLFGTGMLQAQERHLHTLQPRNVLPEQIAPLLAAQVGAGSNVSAYGNQLILNVTDTEYAQLQQLLQQLDSAPRSLLIAVRGLRNSGAQITSGSVRGNWGNDQVRVSNDSRQQPRNSTEVRVEQRSLQGSGSDDQQVRAVEGMSAYIGSGSLQSFRSGYGARQLVPVESGFYATARVIGDEVVVDIDQRDDRVAHRTTNHNSGNTIQTAGINTQVRGKLGEWIPLGGTTQRNEQRETGISSYRNVRTGSSNDAAIKIELLP